MKKVVLISGKMRSGKNQLAEFLRKEFEAINKTVSEDLFASGVKQGCKEDFAGLVSILNRLANEIDMNTKDYCRPALGDSLRINNENWYEKKTPITRALLQSYGTDIFRNRVDDDWWVKDLKARLLESSSDVILVTDVRFPNEIEKLFSDDYELYTIRVNREIGNSEYGQEHASELALDNYDSFMYVIDNNGSLENLEDSAKLIVSEIATVKFDDLFQEETTLV